MPKQRAISYSLTNICHAVEIGTTLTGSWFRGQNQPWNELTPAIFRNTNEFMREWAIAEEFKREAPGIITKAPPWDDHLLWLFLMQHHGAPTRLLDWSKNVLVALYFAVKGFDDKDGELWAMHPATLNERSGFRGFPFPSHPGVNVLAMEPWYNSAAAPAKKLKVEVPKYPLALLPPVHSERVLLQASAFTIHPKPTICCTIPELLTEPKHLVKYRIPATKKAQIRGDLAALGMTEKALFPGLDALSRVIVEKQHVIAYSPPDPPNFAPPPPPRPPLPIIVK